MEKIIHEIAPELLNVYNIREDESEEQQIKTGQLHENRILGIMLKFYLEGRKEVTTRDVELEYKKFYKDIARSTISTYLNVLKKEGTLSKERDGRLVYYTLFENPPDNLSSFWFTRLFCVDPAYFHRAIYFSSLYSIADVIVKKHMKKGNYDEIIDCFRYLTGIIILYVLKNRSSKCILCQFGKQDRYTDLLDAINTAIKDRTDVLPSELQDILKVKYAEIPNFGGFHLKDNNGEIERIEYLISLANRYRKDMEFQTMVLNRRVNSRASEKLEEETKQISSISRT
ncbi:MAG: ArsR/SmtB family transcription factor [Candidatus Hermodarchaeota archaeon]